MIETAKSLIKHATIKRMLSAENEKRLSKFKNFDGLPPELWGCEVNPDGHLSMSGIDLVELSETHGTPLHVADKSLLKKNYESFVGAFRRYYPKVDLATSYKTNPLPGVLSALHEVGTWAEVISEFELWLALKLGMAPEKIILNGPGKGQRSVDIAVENKVTMINLDGPEEVRWVSAAAKRTGHQQNVGLRVVTSVGWSSQFGAPINSGEALDAFRLMARDPLLNPCGLHLHLGTGISNVSLYAQAIEEVLAFGRQVERELGLSIDFYDFGGGFGVPTVRGWDAWDGRMAALGYCERKPIPHEHPALDDYARTIAALVRNYYPEDGAHQPHVIFEPGRAITSSAQVLLLKIMKIKQSEGIKDRVILDGGKNITMPMAWEYHQVFAATKMTQQVEQAVALYGPLCHPGDIVAISRELPQLDTNDVLAIMDAGAYFIPNQMNFSNPRPAAVLIADGKVEEIRAREQYADIVRLDNVDG